MTRDQQRLADYLSHIQEAIERIRRYVDGIDRQRFCGMTWLRMP